jgi:hypothetical protein
MDPEGETDLTHRLEHQELDPLKPYRQPGNERIFGAPIINPLTWIPTAQQDSGWKQAVLDYATQSGHDISTYVPGLDAFSLIGRLNKFIHAGDAIRAAARAAGRVVPQAVHHRAGELMELGRSNLSTSHDALQGITQPALNIHRAEQGGARHLHAAREAEYHAALAPHEQGIHQLDQTLRALGFTAKDLKDPAKLAQIPAAQLQTLREVNKITDTALWRDGTPEVRRSMLRRGFVPSHADRGRPTTNLIERDFGEHYLPEQEIYDPANAAAAKAARGFSYSRGGVKRSAHNQAKTGNQATAPLFERFQNRLESGAYLEAKRRSEKNTIQRLGFAPSNLPRTTERITAIQDRIAKGAAKPGDTKRLGAYQRLFNSQVVEADKAKQLRDAFTAPGATHSDSKIGGVFSGEQSAQGRAARDLAFLGENTGKAFSKTGAVNKLKSAKVIAERSKNRLGELGRGVGNLNDLKYTLKKVDGNALHYVGNSVDRSKNELKQLRKNAVRADLAHINLLEGNDIVSAIGKRVNKDKAYTGDLQIPDALHQRLFGDRVRQEPGVAETLGHGAAGVMFANPLPHYVGNIIEQQTFAGGGLSAVLGGIGKAIKLARHDPQALAEVDEAKRVGATYEKGYESDEAAKPFFPNATHPAKKAANTIIGGAKGAYQGLQRGLTLGHEGQVSELFQRYLKEGKSPEDAAEEVRQTFGRPYETSKEAQKAKANGIPFANWLMSTVPRSTKKLLGSARSRNNLKAYSRGVQDVNSDVFEPEYGVEFNPGGFASRATGLVLRPAAYAASQSLDNALHQTGSNAKANLGDVAKEAVPFLGAAQELGGQPLTPNQRLRGGYKKLPWFLKAPLLTGGYYTHAETPMQKIKRELKREGL